MALGTDGTCDVFTIADEMLAAGWFVQPQLTFAGHPPTLHLTLSAATAPHVEEFLAVLRDAVATAVQAGPVQVDPGVADFVAGPRPGDARARRTFDGLLAAAGLTGDGAGTLLPERMAPVNALLDLAAPALREALLMAFLDRLVPPGPGRPGMSALGGLVDKGLVAPDWAEALAPVDPQIAAMGEFLRAEVQAGHTLPPARRPDPAGLQPTARGRPGARRRPGPLPHAGPRRSGCRSRWPRTSGRCRGAW